MTSSSLFDPGDRFPLGTAGHLVTECHDARSRRRPWGMAYAVEAAAARPTPGAHEKPTTTTKVLEKTRVTVDGRQQSDDYYKTVTD